MKKHQRFTSNQNSSKSCGGGIEDKTNKDSKVMASTVVKKYDDLIRCTTVLTEGIENEFLKFVKHQDECRKKWQSVEEENHDMKKFMAKYKAAKDTLDIQLNMARHQLDAEIKKRLKAEQSVDHMARQLQLIKELLLDKDSSSDTKLVFDKLQQQINDTVSQRNETYHHADLINQSYTLDESSFDLPASEYDNTEDDILDVTGGSILGGGNSRRKSHKRGLPSAPPINDIESTESESGYVKKTRISEEVSKKHMRRRKLRQVHKTISTHVTFTGGSPSKSPSKNSTPVERLDRDFPRPSPQSGRRPPTKSHLKSNSTTDMSDGFEDKENCSTPRAFALKRHQLNCNPLQQQNYVNLQEHQQRNQFHQTFHRHQQQQSSTVTMTKGLSKQMTVPNLYPNLEEMLTPDPKKKFNTLSTPRSARKTGKEVAHNFVTKVAVRMETCGPCKKKVRFATHILKCKECKAMCHIECKEKVPVPCVPTKDTPGRKREGAIECYVGTGSLKVPNVVTSCIEEVERRGLKELGIYRVPGMDKDVKELKEKFLRGKNPDLTRLNDIHVVCGCLKDFLRSLSEPLVTFSLHESFMASAAIADEDDSLSGMYQCISELPAANRETLAAVILHLQKVALSSETQMSVDNLSKVFGPTLVGHRSPNPTHMEMLEDTKSQPKVVARLIEMPSDYWTQLLSGGPQLRTPPYNPSYLTATPTTPECKPVPVSRLGAIDDATPNRNDRKFNAMIPKVASSKDPKRHHRFFNSPS